MRLPTWITTASGRAFDLNEPDPAQITIEDLGAHLSKLCRFTGACRPFYSVAQHCCVVSRLVPARLRLAGLLHDASEAYTGDWSSPLKALVRELAPGLIEQIHRNVERAVEARFDLSLSASDHAIIKRADLVAIATEKRDFMPPDARPGWFAATGVEERDLPPPLPSKINPWTADQAEKIFVDRVKLFLNIYSDQSSEKTPVVLVRPH